MNEVKNILITPSMFRFYDLLLFNDNYTSDQIEIGRFFKTF